MPAPSIETAQTWQGRTMVDPAGDKLGTIDATARSGLFTAKTAFVPLAQAQDMGDSVQVPYDKQIEVEGDQDRFGGHDQR